MPYQHPDTYSAYHLYVIRLKLDEIKLSHRQVFEALRSEGIGVNLHYMPVYLQPYYQRLGFASGLCPEAEAYYRQAISLPLYYSLRDAEQDQVIDTLRRLLKAD